MSTRSRAPRASRPKKAGRRARGAGRTGRTKKAGKLVRGSPGARAARRAAPARSRARGGPGAPAAKGPAPAAPAAKSSSRSSRASGVTAAEIMERDVVTVKPGTPVSEVSALFKLRNIKGAPVVDASGALIGIVTEDDLVFGQLGLPQEERDLLASEEPRSGERMKITLRVAEIMTQNPISASEDTPVEELCRLMSRLKIHRIPIVNGTRVVGIVSTIDVCRMLGEGQVRVVRA